MKAKEICSFKVNVIKRELTKKKAREKKKNPAGMNLFNFCESVTAMNQNQNEAMISLFFIYLFSIFIFSFHLTLSHSSKSIRFASKQSRYPYIEGEQKETRNSVYHYFQLKLYVSNDKLLLKMNHKLCSGNFVFC